MAREVKLNELHGLLSELSYPAPREAVVSTCGDVTLALADGVENLGETVRRSNDDRFESADELRNEVMSLLSRHAVGEPTQSDGDA